MSDFWSLPIHELANPDRKVIGYALYDGNKLLGLISSYDYRDADYSGALSFQEKIFGNFRGAGQARFVEDAYREHERLVPSDFRIDIDGIIDMRRGALTDFLSNVEELAVRYNFLEQVCSAFNIPWYVNAFLDALNGDRLPQLLISQIGVPILQDVLEDAILGPPSSNPGTLIEYREVNTEPLFQAADFRAQAAGTVFVTVNSNATLDSPGALNWSVSPETNTEVFSDASGISNSLLSVGIRDQTVQVGESIAVSSLFPSYLWTDADGSYDITAFAIQDRTVGGGYLEVAGVRVPEATVYEFPISDLSNWRFIAADGEAIDEIGFNIIQTDGDFSPRLTPGARVTTIAADDPNPPPPTPVYPDTIDIDNGNDGDTPLEDDFAEFYAYRSGSLVGDVVLSWRVIGTGSNPASDLDFVRTSGTVTIRDGRDSARITVDFNNDSVYEPDETFKIDFDIVSGNAVFSDDDESATIVNDDTLPPWGIGTDDHGNSLASATFVDGESWAQGFIETPGDVDWFQFYLKGGGSYLIKAYGDNDTSLINDDSSNNAPGLDEAEAILYRADGSIIARLTEASGNIVWAFARDNFELDLQGQPDQTVYLSVRENGDNDVGQYFVQAQVRVEPDDFSADTSTTATLSLNDPFLASHERTGDIDWFQVELEEGTTYRFMAFDEDRLALGSNNLNGSSGRYYFGWNDPRLSIHSSSGAELVATDPDSWPESPNLLKFTAPSSGTYFLAVDSVDSIGRMYDYVSLVQEVSEAPTGVPIVLQPGPLAGVDTSFYIRSPGQAGTDDQWLRANGGFSAALQFDLIGLPVEASYAAVELFLAETLASSGERGDIVIDVPNNSWAENSPLSSLGGLSFHSAIPQPSVGQWVTIEITDLYNQWQSGELANHGIVLSDSETHSTALRFFSSDYLENPSLRPKLVIYGSEAEAQISGTFSSSLTEDMESVSGDISISSSGASAPSFAGVKVTGSLGTLEVNGLGSQWTYTLNSVAQRLDAGDVATETMFMTANNGATQKIEIEITGLDDEAITLGETEWTVAPSIEELTGSLRLFDPDEDDSDPTFVPEISVTKLGTLQIFTDGLWNYRLDKDQRPTNSFVTDRHTLTTSVGLTVDLVFSIEPLIGMLNIIDGSANNDTLNGSGGADIISGFSGRDSLNGNAGSDTIYGGAGDDVIEGGIGGDDVNGGSGIDTASFVTAGSGVTANLTSGVGSRGNATGDTYTSIENLLGSDHDDLLTGSSGNNLIEGGRGRDSLRGSAGNDTLEGGIGGDDVNGGSGIDTASFVTAGSGVTANLTSGVGSRGNA
ncbi:VCBS domain-containing protein, partial [Ruegeria pomeroyi]|nr:VCBS domain-containing protein [Ruegeria pomeroyi]